VHLERDCNLVGVAEKVPLTPSLPATPGEVRSSTMMTLVAISWLANRMNSRPYDRDFAHINPSLSTSSALRGGRPAPDSKRRIDRFAVPVRNDTECYVQDSSVSRTPHGLLGLTRPDRLK
jgi:hypothetical protein